MGRRNKLPYVLTYGLLVVLLVAPSLWLRRILLFSPTLAAGILLVLAGIAFLVEFARRTGRNVARSRGDSQSSLRMAAVGAWALVALGVGCVALHVAFER